MAQTAEGELVDRFEQFYRNYYREEIAELAQNYPSEQRSLFVDWTDLYQFDADIADDYINKPEQLREYAEEALRLYDLPVDVSLGQAHVRIQGLPDPTEIREIRSPDVNTLVSVQGIVRKATDVRPKVEEAAFECQRCGTLSYIPQSEGFQEPHECQGCERQGPFSINYDQSTFVDAQKLRVQESPEGLRGGETPQSIDVNIEDDITGEVTPGDHVTVTGVLRIEQQSSNNEKSRMFDVFMDGHSLVMEDEEFENMDITEADKRAIVELSAEPDIYDQMVDSIAPSIWGYDEIKLAMLLQLFSGVTKHLPDESRIRGDLHMLLIGDPGTGKCQKGDTKVTLSDGRERPIQEIVEERLTDPTPVDDGVYQEVDIDLPSMDSSGGITHQRATKVWKREAPDSMYRIRTESGKELEVTPSHPLFLDESEEYRPVRADRLSAGDPIAVSPKPVSDGGMVSQRGDSHVAVTRIVTSEPVTEIERVTPEYDWVYDLEVEGTHNYISNNVVSHNSQLLQYIRHISPRSVYTSGKGSSAAGLTASAVRDEFGDGQQWTLEAGALVLADKGIAAVDELDKMRCVSGDTLVQLGDRTTRIRDFAVDAAEDGSIEQLPNGRTIRGIDAEAWTMTDEGRLVRRPVTAIHEYDAPETLTDVTLESGESVRATDDHPFFVFEGGETVERASAELEPGDWVYVPRELSPPATDGGAVVAPDGSSSVDSGPSTALAAVLGYLSGDGNVSYNREEGSYGIRFINTEEELLADFEEQCRVAFDADPVRHPSEQRDDGVETVRLHGRTYADAVLDAGMSLGVYDRKTFPDSVSTGTKEAKAAFVRAMADSEGHVDTETGHVRIASASHELLLGIKTLLLEFGVSTQIQTEERTGKRDVHRLAITAADSLRRYNRRIGFTLDRKQATLDEICENAGGDRTIIDVLPNCGDLLADLRDSLRLHQSECGLNDATYCEFENGEANISIHRARTVLATFQKRIERAEDDRAQLSEGSDWNVLARLTDRYHVSQSEIAAGTPYSQPQVSRGWGENPALREVVQRRLDEILSEVSETDLTRLSRLVRSDTKWRRVDSVESLRTETDDHHLELLRIELADHFDCSPDRAEQRARSLLDRDPRVQSWGELREALARHDVSFEAIATDLGVAGSTVSRWFNGVVETDRFDDVREVARERIEEMRDQVRGVLDEIERRREPKVYDLTVEGTHNFVANGMVVHNSEDRSAMHEALEQQSYHPSSEVLLADGRRVEIGEFVDTKMADRPGDVQEGIDCEILPVKDARVHSMDFETNETTKLPIDRVSRHEAPEEFVRVGFSNGREVLVTPEHPMFVDDGGDVGSVAACDIEEGAFVPAPRKLPNSAEPVALDGEERVGTEKDVDLPETMTPDLAEILGFLVAEGHAYAGSAHEIGFSNQDERLLSRMDELVTGTFGIESTDTTNAAGTVTKRWVSTKLYRWFESNVPEVMGTAREKRIPAKVLGASEEEIRRFLVGAFAGDGSVESEAMSFSTASEGLAEDYADALSKIGVASRIHYTRHEDAWKTYVMGDSTERFVEAVVEPADDRYETAEGHLDDLESQCGHRYYRVTDVETVPNEGDLATEWVYDVTVEPTNTFVSQGVALHNSISISKAGINATLKSRCSLLGAANPKYGRFDQYEPIAEQIDLEPALISRFDLIFTVTDQPDEEEDRKLAEHILTTNYAGELNTQRTEQASPNVSAEDLQEIQQDVEPTIDSDLLRKYVAYAKRNVFPSMSEEAREAIRSFYVDLRAQGTEEDAPIPVTARKLEALVRLAEASARVRLSDTVEAADAERVIDIVRSSLQDVGMDPETGEFDADIVETGMSDSQRTRVKNIKELIRELQDEYDEGAPKEEVIERAEEVGIEQSKAEHEIQKLRDNGEVYSPKGDTLRVV